MLHACTSPPWLLWSCCCKDVSTPGHLRIPGAVLVCGTVRTKQRSYLPNTFHVVSLDGTYESWWQPQAGNSVSPIAHTGGRCCLGVFWWHEVSLILSVYPDLHLKYPRFPRFVPTVCGPVQGLYTSQWCRQNLFISSHKFLDSHHILNVSQFLRVQSFAEVTILVLCMIMNSRGAFVRPHTLFSLYNHGLSCHWLFLFMLSWKVYRWL